MSVGYVPFLDRNIIRSACLTDEECDLAINIGSKFCVKAFTLTDCIANSREVSTFCATTIVLARSKKFNRRDDKRKERDMRISAPTKEADFSVKDDYQNELTKACNDGYEPIPINGYVRKAEKNKAYIIPYSEDNIMQHEKLQEVHELSERLREEASLVLTDAEVKIMYEMDGILRIDALKKRYGLKRAEAVAIVNNIYNKLATVSITIN
jgi:hypothetical protein